MRNKPIEIIKALIENPSDLKMEEMDSLVKASLAFFNEFLEISKSGDKEALDKALKELMEFKEALQELTQKAAEKTGMPPEQLAEAMNNPSNYSKEEFDSMKNLNELINSFSKSLTSEFLPQVQKSHVKAKRASKGKQLSV